MHSHREKRIAVVCNHHIDMNPGKVCEHIALHFIAQRHGFKNIKYFELLSPEEHYAGSPEFSVKTPYNDVDEVRRDNDLFLEGIPIVYHRLLGNLDEVTTSDAILFWSSWLHMPIFYQIYKACLLNAKIAANETEACNLIDAHLYFSGQPDEVFDRTLSFCESLIFNTLRHENEGSYAAAYRHFFSRIRDAHMRDIISSRKVGRLRGSYSGSSAFVDAAMLLRDEDIDEMPRTVSDDDLSHCRGKIGVFFGRSDLLLEQVMPVVDSMCGALDAQAFSLPWATRYNFPKTMSLPLPGASQNGTRLIRPGDSLALIRGARAIITDTYHICVNAWARGVPAICMGSRIPRAAVDGNSGYLFHQIDKRQVLYEMLEAMDFYIQYAELLDPELLKSHLEHIAATIHASSSVHQIKAGLRQEALAVERVLVSELDEILSRPDQPNG